eukprot:TRINITY_DN2713_c0_g2_i1.p1 TRINITY_DN2713_c0_g2~~TRINITY_DN2713_c0_g2_i1.p1  ORF type:complete len:257 (-),score=44.67 TRINITY_DN2713_c0_g2_i1:45-815(-)
MPNGRAAHVISPVSPSCDRPVRSHVQRPTRGLSAKTTQGKWTKSGSDGIPKGRLSPSVAGEQHGRPSSISPAAPTLASASTSATLDGRPSSFMESSQAATSPGPSRFGWSSPSGLDAADAEVAAIRNRGLSLPDVADMSAGEAAAAGAHGFVEQPLWLSQGFWQGVERHLKDRGDFEERLQEGESELRASIDLMMAQFAQRPSSQTGYRRPPGRRSPELAGHPVPLIRRMKAPTPAISVVEWGTACSSTPVPYCGT